MYIYIYIVCIYIYIRDHRSGTSRGLWPEDAAVAAALKLASTAFKRPEFQLSVITHTHRQLDIAVTKCVYIYIYIFIHTHTVSIYIERVLMMTKH